MTLKNVTYFDYILFLSVLILTAIGIAFIYSSGVNSAGILVTNEYLKQIIWAISGIIFMFLITFTDYRRYGDRTALIFTVAMFLLVYTRLFGRNVNGARSWIGIGELGIQPSEFTKLVYILFLAWYLQGSSNSDKPLFRFVKAGAILMIPVMLIMTQPDLGTASVYFPVFLAMCFVSGLPVRYICMVLLGGTLSALFTVLPLWETAIVQQPVPFVRILSDIRFTSIAIVSLGIITVLALLGQLMFKKQYYYWIAYVCGIITFSLIASIAANLVLKDFQIMRLIVFLDPNVDPLGSGWNIIQSITAIGSGGPWGMGFLQGTQSHYRFLPQQSTDFIFSILSEEWGFVGGMVVFFLYGIIMYRCMVIIKKAGNQFGVLIATGILAMFFFHFIVNVGMVMGRMPITGIPLLFLSYGGSSLWTAMASIGLLMSINMRRLEQ